MKEEPEKYAELRAFMASDAFPLMTEYKMVKIYHEQLQEKYEKKDSVSLFDD